MTITNELVEKIKEYLGDDGRTLFTELILEKGSIKEASYHVHFTNGMHVRNFMRSTGLCKDWSDHELDDHWMDVVVKAIS